MTDDSSPLDTERTFFASLIDADRGALGRVLSDDFVLIDVMTGSEINRDLLLDLVGSRRLEFEAIEPAEALVRAYGSSAVVTGRTEMSGRFDGAPFSTRSRYTHVFVEQRGQWRLVSAQGTPIASAG